MRPVIDIINQAFALHRNGDFVQSAAIYDKLIGAMDDPDPNVLMGYGLMLCQSGHNGLAKHLLQEAVQKLPEVRDAAPAWCNLGAALKALDREEAARQCYLKSIELEPENPTAFANMAGLYVNSAEPQTAEMWARKAIELDPENPGAHNHLGLALLEQERFDEAWPHTEYRWKLPENLKNVRDYGCPRWDGNKVHTLIIHGEQGLGDEILFMSVIDKVRPFAKRIVIECADRLLKLFETSFDLEVHPNQDELKRHVPQRDAHIPMASLFSMVGFPSGKPFLRTTHLKQMTKPLIGISWKGGVPRTHKKHRTIKLEQLRPILDVKNVQFVNLQYGGDEIVGEAKQAGLYTPEDRSFNELVSWVASCDLVISVCQTNVHISGGLGIPCWVLTPHAHAWRYAGRTERMRYYDSIRLYRQDETCEWAPVITKMAYHLADRYA